MDKVNIDGHSDTIAGGLPFVAQRPLCTMAQFLFFLMLMLDQVSLSKGQKWSAWLVQGPEDQSPYQRIELGEKVPYFNYFPKFKREDVDGR